MDTIKVFFESLWKLVQDFVGPLGGLVFVIAGIAKFFADKIADRNLAKINNQHTTMLAELNNEHSTELLSLKNEHSKEMAELKKTYLKETDLYKTQLEVAKSALARYSEQQFDIYNKLWSSLYELRSAGDKLWESANNQVLYQFVVQLKDTKEIVEKSSLFIEDSHFEQLQLLLKTFSEYQVGKKKVIDLRSNDKPPRQDIIELVDNNGQILEQYTNLISDLRKKFRLQINVKLND